MTVRASALHGGEGAAPQTFVRHLTAPPGLPWEQRRAAELEARMGAPGGGAGLQLRIVRTAPWRPGAEASFASVYLRGGEALDRFDAEVKTPTGRTITVPFRSAGAARRELMGRCSSIAAIAAPLVLTVLAVAVSLAVRSDRELRIQAIEARAAQADRIALARQRAAADAASLRRAGADGHRVQDALADLQWLSAARDPGAHIQSVHWEHGLMAIAVRGQTPPARAEGREVRKAEKPLGPGLYLWGIGASAGAPRR